MKKRNWIAFITAVGVAAGTMASTAYVTNAGAAETDGSEYKIMCVGDSITHGYISGDNGYRKYLCYYLQEKGISYDMVGPENSWSDEATYDWNGTTITYDPQHCGYSGYAIQQYGGRSGIYETLFGNGDMVKTYDPDMILLQIGTNDLLDARLDKTNDIDVVTDSNDAIERLEKLVDKILESSDSTDTLFLASIPFFDAEVRADWFGNNYSWIYGIDASNTAVLQAKVDECVAAYNAGVMTIAAEKKSQGYNVEFCDINSVVDMKSGLYDGVHPNESGYAEMGKLWANTISSYLGAGQLESTTTATTMTTSSETTITTETTTTSSEITAQTTTTNVTTSSIAETTSITKTETTAITTTTTSSVPVIIQGDVNGDGDISMVDCVWLRKYIVNLKDISEINYAACDMDGDGYVNIFDVLRLLKFLVLIS